MSAITFDYDFTDNRDGAAGGCSFWARQGALVRTFSRAVPDRAADLLDVLGAIYTADRRSKRCFNGVSTGQRRISIRMPVREPELWSSPETEVRLKELLSWVSGDVWAFEFTRQDSVRGQDDSQGFLFEVPLKAPAMVSLFSGGLDSLAGLAYHSLGSPGGSRTPGVRLHPQPSGRPTDGPGEADQSCVEPRIARSQRRREARGSSLRCRCREARSRGERPAHPGPPVLGHGCNHGTAGPDRYSLCF